MLAPYAVRPESSRGRLHPEPSRPEADPFAVDRRRILRCAAFRRLQHKTQVFVAHEHDHFRTRLTHTLEVVELAGRLSEALGVNATLAETIALAHDLGHPPFGHAGEEALRDRMSRHGGFEHNAQALRTVEYLEHPYPPFRGLNLTSEVREGLAKHHTKFDRPAGHELADGLASPLEGQIACIADRIAYDSHDLEDAIGSELVNADDLRSVRLWRQAAGSWDASGRTLFAIRRPVLDALEDAMVRDVIEQTRHNIRQAAVGSVEQVRRCRTDLVAFSPVMLEQVEELEAFLLERLYRHHRLVRMDDRARRIIERLFEAYLDDPAAIPPRFSRRIPEQGIHRVVCDYIAGMTDRFCEAEYARMCSSSEPL